MMTVGICNAGHRPLQYVLYPHGHSTIMSWNQLI